MPANSRWDLIRGLKGQGNENVLEIESGSCRSYSVEKLLRKSCASGGLRADEI